MDYLKIIKQALYKAEDPRTPENEKEISRAHAYRLMAEMQISEADLAAHGEGPKEEIQVREIWLSTPRVYSFEYATFAARIAEVMGARGLIQKVYYTDSNRKKRCGAHWIALLIGFPGDLDRAQLLFNSLGVQCEQAVVAGISGHHSWGYMTATDKYNYKRSFVAGFKERVSARLKSLYTEVAEESTNTGAALVLVDRKKQITDFVDATLNPGKSATRSYAVGGARDGAIAGSRANLGQTTLGESRRAIGGQS
jgi:hypothetical protein